MGRNVKTTFFCDRCGMAFVPKVLTPGNPYLPAQITTTALNNHGNIPNSHGSTPDTSKELCAQCVLHFRVWMKMEDP